MILKLFLTIISHWHYLLREVYKNDLAFLSYNINSTLKSIDNFILV